MSFQNDRKVCCFGVVETAYIDGNGRALPARTAPPPTRTVMVERASVPRTILVNAPLPPRHAIYTPLPAQALPQIVSVSPPPPSRGGGAGAMSAEELQRTADQIAEILMPTTTTATATATAAGTNAECFDIGRMRGREYRAHVAHSAVIESEAIRRVRERNERDDHRATELRALEDLARARIENDFRSSTSSLRSSSDREYTTTTTTSSRDRLVVVEQNGGRGDRLRNHRCSNCHEFGHRSRDCDTDVVVSVSRPERRASVAYHPPRKQVRYVNGL